LRASVNQGGKAARARFGVRKRDKIKNRKKLAGFAGVPGRDGTAKPAWPAQWAPELVDDGDVDVDAFAGAFFAALRWKRRCFAGAAGFA
jgi:hypothetical protein